MRVYAIIFIFVISGACSSKGESALSKGLAVAVREKKITQKKMEYILAEYDKLRDEDKTKAREYVDEVLNAIEMGGDSTHIDAARRLVLRRQGERKV
jgi:hypothetical protein